MNEEFIPVKPGLLVEIEITYVDTVERLSFVIVPDELADFANGFLGVGAPLAQAILDKPVGSQINYIQGDARSVKILSAAPTERKPDIKTAQRREETIRQAVEQSERTNAMMFASSFSGKWGDYDPNAITKISLVKKQKPKKKKKSDQ